MCTYQGGGAGGKTGEGQQPVPGLLHADDHIPLCVQEGGDESHGRPPQHLDIDGDGFGVALHRPDLHIGIFHLTPARIQMQHQDSKKIILVDSRAKHPTACADSIWACSTCMAKRVGANQASSMQALSGRASGPRSMDAEQRCS